MMDPIDLEIGLRWRQDIDGFDVNLVHSNPLSNLDERALSGTLQLDRGRLAALVDDEDAYSRLLSESLFAVPDVARFFEAAQASAESAAESLRLRLLVDPTAPAAFNAVRWETLRDPRDGLPIATKANVLFSRYLVSSDWRPTRVRPKRELSALVAVANPVGVEQYAPGGTPLVLVDVAGELARAQAALRGYPVTFLAPDRGVTLDNITAELQRGGHAVLFLVCHGTVLGGEPRLYLEGSDGGVVVISGAELAEGLRQLEQQQPTLVVLSACQTAGAGDELSSRDDGALAALGPRLAEVGIPATVAMQGNVTMRTVAAFLPTFFEEVERHGVVDLAMAAARQAVRDRPDWWTPVLYMRLRSGRMWYQPAFEPPRQVQLRVFLCHSSSDKPAVRMLYRSLRDDDMSPWLDEENLLPGQDWEREIRNAIRTSHAVLVCLSKGSISKVGFIQKEIREVLDRADEQPEGTIWLIPVRLEPCEVPERIRRWQWVDLFADDGYGRLMRALRHRAASLLASE
jgi:hypothetical protein